MTSSIWGSMRYPCDELMSVWGPIRYFNYDSKPSYNMHLDPTTISHTEILDIGVNSHPEIDLHLAKTTNPHGTTLIQTTMKVGNLQTPSLTVNGVSITSDTLTSVPSGTPITMSGGVKLGSNAGLLSQYYSVIIDRVPSQGIWATLPTLTWLVRVWNGAVILSLLTPHIAAVTVNQSILFPNLIPVGIRPAANVTVNLLTLRFDSASTGITQGSVGITTDGTVSLNSPTGAWSSNAGPLNFSAYVYHL